MKHFRRLSVLFLCVMLLSTASTALAAKKVNKIFTAKPTMKLTVPKRGIYSGGTNDFTVNASAPGYLTVRILDASGYPVQTVVENLEIHSKENVIDFFGVDDAGNPLYPGNYQLSFEMVTQFGVASEVLTRNLEVKPSTDAEVLTALSAITPSNRTAITTNGAAVSGTTGVAATTGAASAATTGAAAPAAAPVQELTYVAGEFFTGDEGLMIGVGVPDVAPQQNAGYWSLTSDSTDAEIWSAIIRPMVSSVAKEQESAYIYNTPAENRKRLGTISGLTQGVNVITERSDGWSLVEAYRNEDGAFVRGYVRTNKLRTVDPNTLYGIVIDKKTQTLTVYKEGARLGSCAVSTGLPTYKYLHRETPAGEFITATRRGTIEYYGMGFTKDSIRINGSYHLTEIPTTKKKGSDYSLLSGSLGSKATRGNICIAHDPSVDGGINADWIWNMTDENKKVKVLILDDKERTQVPQGEK